MRRRSILAQIRTGIRPLVMKLRRAYFNRVWGMSIGHGTFVSMSAKLDVSNPTGIIIGEDTTIAFGAAILSHDPNGTRQVTHIGSHCFIGAHSVVLSGVSIGDHCIVSAGSVVVRNVAPNTWVSGNPARTREGDIMTGPGGNRIWFA